MRSFKTFGWHSLALLVVSAILNTAAVHAAAAAVRLEPVLQGLSAPVYVTNAHDGSQRLFVVEQPGRIKVLPSGATAPDLFLDIASKVMFDGGEQGLLGLAFHPLFATNGRFFVNYTRRTDGATVVAEYHASSDPDVTAASESILLAVAQPHANHNGGMIEFGADGFLYIGIADSGSSDDPGSQAQNSDELPGKILRIDVDHPADGQGYSSPASNPFAGATPGRDEIFAMGVHNPFRFSFDRQTGQLYLGDAGLSVLEEVDIVTAGGNYGWPVYEGAACANLDPERCMPANYVAPIAQYNHSGGRCSIVGGYVYRGGAAALPPGTYVFGDACSGEIFSWIDGVPSVLLDTTKNLSSFGEDESGEIYVADLGGSVHRIAFASPTLAVTPETSAVSIGAPAASAMLVGIDSTTQGNWKTHYGSDGYAVIGESTSYPAYAQVAVSGKNDYTWVAQSDSDPRTLQRAITAGRIAACWYSGGSFNIELDLTDAASHRVTLYFLDWDAINRSVRVDVLDAGTQQVLGTQTVAAYQNGVYLVWELRGHVIVRLTNLGGAASNAVMSGLFFDPVVPVPTYTLSGTVSAGATPLTGVHFSAPGGGSCPDSDSAGNYACTVPQGWSGTVTPALSGYAFTPASRSYSSVAANQSAQNYAASVVQAPPTNSATLVGTDSTTQGNWKTHYGSDGYAVIGESTSYPAYAQVAVSGKNDYTWVAQSDSDPRTLQRAITAGRIAACWYSGGSFNIELDLTDAASHRVTLYLLDWDAINRSVRVDVLDAGTQQVLGTQTVAAYQNGVYLVWELRGHVIVRLTNLNGAPNVVMSGLFFDPVVPVPTYTLSGTVSAGATPLTGVHFSAPGGGSCPDSDSAGNYACTVPQGWSGTVTPALSGYAFTPASRSYSSVAANQSAQNYAASVVQAPPTNSATLVGIDSTTQGNWKTHYGSDGYAVIGESTSYPAYAQVAVSGKNDYTWVAQSDSDPRTLQRAITAGRIAACWYSGGSFNIELDLTDAASHRVTLYLLDWDAINRSVRVDVLDAGTQQVLGTQTVAAYQNGVYLVWELRGHVIVRLTNLNGAPNVVMSGLFFDPVVPVPTYTLSGTVSAGATPLTGVHFSAPGGGSCPDSDSAGNYACTVPQGWSGTVTPALSGYAFTPASRSYSSVAANQSAQNYAASAVQTAPTTTTLGSAPNPTMIGTAITFTATVSGASPSGSVSFTENGTALSGCGTVALAGSSASCTLSTLSAGTHHIVATYSGDAANAASSSAPLAQVIYANSATLVGVDGATQGNWKTHYGSDGYAVIGESTSYPAYAQVAVSGKNDYTWVAQSDSDPRTLQRAITAGRIAACWYSGGSFNIELNLTDAASHRVTLYLLDWDAINRSVRVDVLDAGTQQVLGTQTVAAYQNGVYLVWELRGHVIVRLTNLNGAPNVVMSGLFFDPVVPVPTYTLSGTVSAGATPLTGVHFSAPGGGSCPDSDSAGNYACTVPQGWSGTVTPALSGYAFTPASRSYSSVAANQSAQNYAASAVQTAPTTTTLGSAPNPTMIGTAITFTATVSGASPSGSVSFTENGTALSGCGTVALAGSSASCTLSTLSAGTHHIVATYSGDAVNAASSSAPLAQVIFSDGLTLTLSGTVYAAGAPLAGVRFDSSGGEFYCPNSDSSGHYFCMVSIGWSGTVTPVLAGYTFSPSQRTYENVTADETQDYVAIPQ